LMVANVMTSANAGIIISLVQTAGCGKASPNPMASRKIKLRLFRKRIIFSLKPLFNQGSRLGERPEPFNVINMFFLTGKFVLSLMDTIVFFVSQVNKAIVTAPDVKMEEAFRPGSTLTQIMACTVFR